MAAILQNGYPLTCKMEEFPFPSSQIFMYYKDIYMRYLCICTFRGYSGKRSQNLIFFNSKWLPIFQNGRHNFKMATLRGKREISFAFFHRS